MGKGSGKETCQRVALNVENGGQNVFRDQSPKGRSVASMMGISCGDAIGFPTELIRDTAGLKKRLGVEKVVNLIPGNKNKFGVYSDDTQQTLMIARCIHPNGEFDIDRWSKQELPLWWEYFRGAGYTSSVAVESLQKGADWDTNFFSKSIVDTSKQTREIDYRKSDSNGTVMRVAPLGIALGKKPSQLKIAVWQSSVATHGHPGAALAAHLHAQTVSYLLDYPEKLSNITEFLEKQLEKETLPQNSAFDKWREKWESEGELLEDHFQKAKNEIRWGLQTIKNVNESNLDSVMSQLHITVKPHKTRAIPTWLGSIATALAFKGNAENSMINAANRLGSDTDTLAAISGTLCGLVDGGESRPQAWDTTVQDQKYIENVGQQLYAIRNKTADKSPGHGTAEQGLLYLPQALAKNSVYKGLRINHQIFGAGKITNIRKQNPKSKAFVPNLYITVQFDCGQSCRFRSENIQS